MNPSLAAKAALLLALALPAQALATPLDATRIPAEADGVGHIDMDALRRTSLHRLITPKFQSGSHWNDMDPKLRPLVRTLFDVAQGVSFWLTDRDTGAVLIRVPDPKRIQAMLDRLPRKGQIRVAGQLVGRYSLSGDRSGDKSEENLAAMVGNHLVMADDEKSIARAIDALSGRGRSLAQRGLPDGALQRGVFFFTALNGKLLDEVKNAAQSATLRLNMSSLTVHVGEARSELSCRVKMTLGSAEEATKLKSMAEGILALASMSDEAVQLRPFTKNLKITAAGKALEVSVSMPSAELVKLIESNH
jgi:hypothetical protein